MGFEAYVESGERALKQLDNYVETAKRIKRMVEEVWSSAKVYVFGSVLEKKYTAMSDIDILIVVNGVGREEVYKTKAMIYKTIEAPIELHVTSEAEFQNWYKRFIEKLEEIT